jgi:hypothetical protein
MGLFFIQGLIADLSKKYRSTHTPPKRNFEVDMESDLMKELQPCDIILHRFSGKKDFVGGVISYITSSPYGHAEIHMFDGYDISAGPGGVTFVDLYKGNIKESIVDLYRLKRKLTREERLIIQAKAYQILHKPYDYVNLVGFNFLDKKAAIQRAGNEAYVCAEAVAWIYNNAAISLIKGVPESIIAPADLGHSDILDYIGTFKNNKKINGNFRNEFLSGQEVNLISKMLAKIINAFNLRDEYYKGIALNKEMLEGKM